MTWFVAFLPHGAKVHATRTPPDNRPGIMVRDRTTLCGRPCYSGGPTNTLATLLDFYGHAWEVCSRCQARIDRTLEQERSTTKVPPPPATDTRVTS